VILSDFPDIFGEFRGKQSLFWGAAAATVLVRVTFTAAATTAGDTLIVILDTDLNIFGGFTPVEWDSPLRLGAGMASIDPKATRG
jgi:hypothetical protein